MAGGGLKSRTMNERNYCADYNLSIRKLERIRKLSRYQCLSRKSQCFFCGSLSKSMLKSTVKAGNARSPVIDTLMLSLR